MREIDRGSAGSAIQDEPDGHCLNCDKPLYHEANETYKDYCSKSCALAHGEDTTRDMDMEKYNKRELYWRVINTYSGYSIFTKDEKKAEIAESVSYLEVRAVYI